MKPPTPPEAHDFSVQLAVFRLCSKCAKPDLAVVRRRPCKPLPEEDAKRRIERQRVLTRKLRGDRDDGEGNA